MCETIQRIVETDETRREIKELARCSMCSEYKSYRDLCDCWKFQGDKIIKKEVKTK